MRVIRPEGPLDVAAIYAVNRQAFETSDEAELVNTLRDAGAVTLSLVAEEDGQVVGHCLFSPVTIGGVGTYAAQGVGLGPVAVLPAFQRRGIGSELIRQGLALLAAGNHALCVVLGHPSYYPRFGFRPSQPYGIYYQEDLPPEVFMVAELLPGALQGVHGQVQYHSAFDGV